ncbi:MAG TPA: APC family permease [Chitinophagaceae bacterium]|nr:APC family permease [Chitinophagaceae bacterium]
MQKRLRPIQLAFVIFLTVSGGPYGLEPLLQFGGPNASLLLLMITPFLWDVPSIFMVLELNSMMPVTGGYYQWVKRALGQRWAFYEGWWTWLYTFVDLAIYPVWFVTYCAFFFPSIMAYKVPVCLAIVWFGAILNIIGIVRVGKTSMILGTMVLVPFVAMFATFFFHHGASLTFPALSFKGASLPTTGMALYYVMWNFLGWDNATTYAEEVDKPIRSYLISIAITFCMVFVLYGLTIYTAQSSGIDFKDLSENGLPRLGELIGGKWLGAVIAFGGMASMLGIFSAVLLSMSRVPKAMADDKLLPAKLNSLHSRYNTPHISIIVCAVIVSIMVNFDFEELVILDVMVYGAGLVLEMISLIALRIKEPNTCRPFKIPLKTWGLCIMVLSPLTLLIIALSGAISASDKTLITAVSAVAALLSAEIGWQIIKIYWNYKGKTRALTD